MVPFLVPTLLLEETEAISRDMKQGDRMDIDYEKSCHKPLLMHCANWDEVLSQEVNMEQLMRVKEYSQAK